MARVYQRLIQWFRAATVVYQVDPTSLWMNSLLYLYYRPLHFSACSRYSHLGRLACTELELE
jgi:hypothetical protein